MNGPSAPSPEDRRTADRLAGELARLVTESTSKTPVRRAALERLAYLLGEDGAAVGPVEKET